MKLFVGFDPGGEKKFGWAICSSEGSRLQILQTGKADHAEGALGAVKAAIPYRAKIIGAGLMPHYFGWPMVAEMQISW